jgi:hypothetical protein
LKPVLTAVSCFDAHYPKLDHPTWGAVKDFLRNTKSPEWAVHLRPEGKRKFHKAVRRTVKKITKVKEEL